MNEVIHPVFFPNKNDRMLFGILQQPKNARHDAAVVFLSPGIKSRVGPHRLYVKMAERFTQMGFAVLRVDPEGLGDSEGEIDADHTADVYTSIQLGRYIWRHHHHHGLDGTEGRHLALHSGRIVRRCHYRAVDC